MHNPTINAVLLQLADTNLMPATHITAFIILILILLFLGAIAAGAEVAFFTLNAKDVNYLKTKEQNSAQQVVDLLEHPDLLLSTLRASKYTLAIAVVIAANYMTRIIIPVENNLFLSFLVILLSITFLLLLMGEVLPKVYARQNNVRMALFAAPIVKGMFSVFKPLSVFLTSNKEPKNGRDYRKVNENTHVELEDAIELSLGHSASKEEVDIFKGIMKFGKITVKQIMQPRLEISGIRKSWNFVQVREKMLSAGYTRMPVYNNNVDEIEGMIFTKDFLPYTEVDEFDWQFLIRPAFFVHEHKLIEDLLQEFQSRRLHFAVVVDEFGGTSGIVTLEDIMEEIIGDIKDEFDEEEHNFRKIDDDNYIFEGRVLLNDMLRIMGLPFETFDEVRGDSDSLAGLILELAGKFPAINEHVSYGQFNFIILSIDKLRIGKVKIELTDA